MASHVFLIRQETAALAPWWFLSLAFLGAAYVAGVTLRLLIFVALCLRHRSKDLRWYGAWAVVTGPMSGIGRAMALELARRGLNLVLVGRDPASLRDISFMIHARHQVQTKTVVFDLSLVSTPDGNEPLRRLRKAVEGLDVGVVVNNAGVGGPAMVYLHEADVEASVRMMRVNLWAVTEVTAAVLPGMMERGRGAVVNIGSASSQAIPSFPLCSIYAATKRYIAQFSRSLHVEYASKGIHVQCQVPFFVATRMVENLVEERRLSLFTVTADAYARAAVAWIRRGDPLCTPSVRHQLQWCIAAAVPDSVLDWLLLRSHLEQRTLFQQIRATGAPSPSSQHEVHSRDKLRWVANILALGPASINNNKMARALEEWAGRLTDKVEPRPRHAAPRLLEELRVDVDAVKAGRGVPALPLLYSFHR